MTQRRKTLDEIRREVDADFAEAAIPQAASDADIADRSLVADADAPAARMRRVAQVCDVTEDDPATQRFYAALTARAERRLRRPSRSGSYLIAGVVGCIIGQIVLLGFVAVIGEQQTVTTSTAATAAPETRASRPISSLPPSVPSPMAPPSVSSSPPTPASASSAPPPAPVVTDSKPTPRRVVNLAPTEPSSRSPVSAAPSASSARKQSPAHNLAMAQEEVRAALGQWIGTSGRGDHSIVSDAVVILGPDGRTARTQVPTRWGAHFVIREQLWERGARGWTLIDDRDARQVR